MVAAAVVMIALQGDLFREPADAPAPDLAHAGRVRVFRVEDQVAGEASGRRLFGDCLTCAVFVPAAEPDDGPRGGLIVPYRAVDRAGYKADRFWLCCPTCGEWRRGRAVALRQSKTPTAGIMRDGRRYCNGACLNRAALVRLLPLSRAVPRGGNVHRPLTRPRPALLAPLTTAAATAETGETTRDGRKDRR